MPANFDAPRWPVNRLAQDPNNPPDRIEDVSDITSTLDTVGGITGMGTLSVVDRDVYLREYPKHANKIGDVDFVVIDGNRRLQAAINKGLLDVPINRDNSLIGGGQDSRVRIITGLIHRKLAPTQEARELQLLLSFPGETTRSVGASYGKSHSHVSKRLKLLDLAEPIQRAVDAPTDPLPVIDALTLADLDDQDDQLAAWAMVQKGRKAKSAVSTVRANRSRSVDVSDDDGTHLRTLAIAARDGACVELLARSEDPDERSRAVATLAVRGASGQVLKLAHHWLRGADLGPALDDPAEYAAAAAQRPDDLLRLAYAVAIAADELHARDARRDTWDARATMHHQRLTAFGHLTTEWDAAHLSS